MFPILSNISRQRKLKLLKRFSCKSDTVLEVGSGSGWFSEQLRKYGYPVTTLDIKAPAMIVGDINQWLDLGIKPCSYDIVVALEVIEHVDCLDTLRSICKPGGLIFLSSPHPRWDWLMKWFEALHLTQQRSSAHVNLTDFNTISMPVRVKQRPLYIHQVALFINH